MKRKRSFLEEREAEMVDFTGIELASAVGGEEAEAYASAHNWESPGSLGHRIPRQGLEDEKSQVEELVNQGLDEADRELRMATDPDREEE